MTPRPFQFRIRRIRSLIAQALGMLLLATARAEDPAPYLWDLQILTGAPGFRWEDEASPIRSLIYEGSEINHKATEVFAFYADPTTLAGDQGTPAVDRTYPGVVLIHGGGGTAFADWVDLWARRGYAAIAMDLSGRRPPPPEFDAETGLLKPHTTHDKNARVRLEHGGLDHTHAEKFASIGGEVDTDDEWPYHAVENVILAHSLLRSFDRVDAERTAVTGISWGGYTTCLVASVDTRFKAAVPVYGCGFLHEGESIQKPSIDALEPELRQLWIDRYDPGSHLPRCRVPILFVNGTHDKHYVLDSYAKSYAAVPGAKNIRIELRMRHGHQPGWAPEEIGLFIDSHCRDGVPLPRITEVATGGEHGIRGAYESRTAITIGHLHYTTDTGLRSEREWQTRGVTIDVDARTFSGPALPSDANTWIVTLTDDRGAMVSSEIQLREE